MKKAESIEDLKELRSKLESDYENTLPDYLESYLKDEELEKKRSEFFKERYQERSRMYKETTPEERKQYAKKRNKEFWENEQYELVKKSKRTSNPVYTESVERNTEKVDQERDLTQDEINALITICEKDIYLFAIRYFSHYLKKPSSSLHRYLYNFLNRNLNKKNRKRGFKHAVAAPRGNAKSTVISTILPIWCIAYNKKRFIIICSDTSGQAEDFLSDIKRELENNALLKRDFPYLANKGPTWRMNEIITKNNVKILALGTGSKIRGRRFGVDRPDLLINDDLESSDMVRSKTMREFVRYDWFNKDLLYVGGEEGSPCDILVVGTVLGKDSLLNALLSPEEYPDWTNRRFKAVLEFSDSNLWIKWGEIYKDRFNENRVEDAKDFFIEHKDEMLQGTEVLWPEGEPYYELMIYKLSNYSGFLTEKQNDPIDASKILVTQEQLHFENFSTNPLMRDILLNPRNTWYGAIDPSLGKYSDRNDYSCIPTICRDRASGSLLVVSFDLKRRKVDDQIDAILKNHLRYHYQLFGVETNAFQLVVADNLRKKSKKDGIYVPIKEIQQSKDKKMRIEGIVPLILDGTIIFDSYAYRHNQQYNLSIEQIVTFTGENDAHDDAPDGLEMVVTLAKQKRFKMLTKQTR